MSRQLLSQMIRPHHIILPILLLIPPNRLRIRHLPIKLRTSLTPPFPFALALTTSRSRRLPASAAHESVPCFAFAH